MSITDVLKQGEQFVKDNSSTLLTAVGVAGTVGTAVLTGRATLKASHILHEEALQHSGREEGRTIGNDFVGLPDFDAKEKVKMVWPLYIPPIVTGTLTITSIVMANRINSKKIATLAALYGLSEQRLKEYRDKVAEKVTGPKATDIRDSIAQDRVNNTPGSEVIITGDGKVLCFDPLTGRYFESTNEDLKRAENRVNEIILNHEKASLSDFCDQIGLKRTTLTDEIGWNLHTSGLCDLYITSTIADNDRPCLVVDFENSPTHEYVNRD